MKLRLGFVTNSSSTNYIIAWHSKSGPLSYFIDRYLYPALMEIIADHTHKKGDYDLYTDDRMELINEANELRSYLISLDSFKFGHSTISNVLDPLYPGNDPRVIKEELYNEINGDERLLDGPSYKDLSDDTLDFIWSLALIGWETSYEYANVKRPSIWNFDSFIMLHNISNSKEPSVFVKDRFIEVPFDKPKWALYDFMYSLLGCFAITIDRPSDNFLMLPNEG